MIIYTYLKKTSRLKGLTGTFANLKRLVEFDVSLNYNTLLNHFSRKRATYYEDSELRITIIKSESHTKGLHRVKRGPGVHSRNI
jgi:hypothetical protein